ncbi:MAG: site-2 protease family protein [Clostridia bacterium]|nr:site-2 protease family protein [Clostridia bacterium]
MTVLYVLAAIVMLGVMVTVHEAGHFFAARMTGIPVKEFSIGMGPKLVSWKRKKHETQFSVRLIPAGGYCMFYGEDDTEGKEAKEDPRSIGKFAPWRRMITIFMGPAMNFVLALIVAAALYGAVGEDSQGYFIAPQVVSVEAGSPAEQAGILPGDSLETVNGQSAVGVTEDGTAWNLTALINSYQEGGEPLTLGVRRGEEPLTLRLSPKYSETGKRYLIGVSLNPGYVPVYTPVGVFRAVQLGADYCVRAAGAIVGALKDLITTGAGLEQTSGPVGIVKLIAEETQKSAAESVREAFLTYGELLVMISVNLGLFNLIPIPGLDGSRLVFLLIEAIRRKPVPQKVEAYVHMAGYVLLFGLMIVMTYKDVLNIFR